MAAPKSILKLIEHFQNNRETYEDPRFNETQTRIQFLNPLFEALGWDVANSKGYAEAYKDVVHEDAVKVGGATKAPDYSFRIGGTRKFFLEAKKPAIKLKDDGDPAFQLRRYAWSAKLPISALSNFSSLAIYDCRSKPHKDNKASASRIHLWTCEQYAEKWDEIAAILSKDAVLKGSFDRFAASSKGKHGTAEVDSEFLLEIEDWREQLAKSIARRNPRISQRELNFSVQQTIDRIIFLRICEDRGIEHYGNLLALQNGSNIYDRLKAIYRQADERYNSGLFHFQSEQGRKTPPDSLTLGIQVDDKVLKTLFKRLYYPDSPYEFSVISADILGQVYEQFLGKVIRLTAGGTAKVDDKPEVKKAGGVYYTPTYIVDYIVQRAIGPLLEGKAPRTLKRLNVLDPACGSGSFLLVAYQYLLDWYLKHYSESDPEALARGKSPKLYKAGAKEWRLTTAERKRILLEHIYGVDIDPQAVEVTKLSLLLKVLEGEKAEGLPGLHYRERLLPDLDENIKCGNSLIDSDFIGGLFESSSDESVGANPFNWESEFPGVFKNGRFDAVVGNPPYGALFGQEEKNYLFQKYSRIKGQPESYEYFIDRALDLVAKSGFVSFIVPTNFTESERAAGLRERLLREGCLRSISNFRYNVWKSNAAETLVFVYEANARSNSTNVNHPTAPEDFSSELGFRSVDSGEWLNSPGHRFLLRADTGVLRRIEKNSIPLGSVGDVSQGIIAYKTRADGEKNAYISDKHRGADWKRLLDTKSSISRYGLDWGGSYLKYGDWLWCPRDPKYFEQPKILFVRLRNKSLHRRLIGTLDEEKYYNRDNFNNIILADARYSLKYLLGLFNSTLINYWYKSQFDNVNINPAQVRRIPIKSIDFANKVDVAMHEKIVDAVSKLLDTQSRISRSKAAQDRSLFERQLRALDMQLDELVFELYGLDKNTIAVVQNANAIET